MSTSSQYYRSANTHSHYPNFSANNHEHLYVLAAASWHQDPNHASYTGPPSAPYLHYPQGGADSVSHSSSASASQSWSAGYARQNNQAWDQSVGDHAFASRSAIPYDAAEGSASVPHPQPVASRQYQHQQTLNTRQDLPLSPPGNAYRRTDRFPELQISSVGVQRMLCRTLICD